MKSKLSIAQKGLIVILVLITSELVFVSFLTLELNSVRQRLQEQRHNRQIIQHLNSLAGLSQKGAAEMFKSIMVPNELRDQFDIGTFERFVPMVRKEARTLKTLVRDDPDSLNGLKKIEDAVASTEVAYKYLYGLSRPKIDLKEIQRVLEPGKRLSTECDRLLLKYSKRKATNESPDSLNRVKTVLFIGIALGLLTMAAAFLFFKKVAERLLVVTDNSQLFVRGERLAAAIGGTDEIAELDALFHELVKDLNDAFEQERFLIRYATDVVCSVDTRGRFIDVSSAALEQWGYDPDGLIEQDVATTIGCTGLGALIEGGAGTLGSERQFVHEEALRCKDGKVLESLWSIYWSPKDGSLFCCVRDITEMKRIDTLIAAQEQLVRSAIENMPIGIMKSDPSGSILSINATARRMFNLDEQEDTSTFKVDSKLVPLDDSVDVGRSVLTAESTVLRCKLGFDQRIVDLSIGKRTSDGSRLLLLNDVTERHRLEELKNDFVTLLGRNLHQPLESMRDDIQVLIKKSRLDDKTQSRLMRIDSNIGRLLSLIDQLLTVERLGSDRLSGELSPCAIADAVRDAVDSIRDYAEQQRIEIQLESKTQGLVLADYQRLVQVIVNLISNAIKYSPDKAVVSLTVSERSGVVEVRVVDQGRGVPEDKRFSIFEPFVQAESSDGRRGVGTGLGLSICKRIIEDHKGSIGVDGRAEAGSEFWIRIPLQGSAAT